MDFIQRFAGAPQPDAGGRLTANLDIANPLTLQVLFPNSPPLGDEAELLRLLRGLSPETADARLELRWPVTDEPTLGLVGWGRHVVKLIAADEPIPADLIEPSLRFAHFRPALKADARAHASHALLYYGGFDYDPFEQYAALAAVAAALARAGAVMVLNAAAKSAFPAAALAADEATGDLMAFLRGLPVPMLYGGFAKIEVEDDDPAAPEVWVRTFGNHLLELPDLAFRTAGHHEGDFALDLFASVLDYLRAHDKRLAAGDTMQADDDLFLRFREPEPGEFWLESLGQMLIAERVGPDEMNLPPHGT